MSSPSTSRRFEFLKGILLFLGFGMCLSCLSVMERRMGLVGRDCLQPARPMLSIPRIGDNLSGITRSATTGTFFAVTNSPQAVFELTPQGNILRRMEMRGFSDTEDIAHIEGELFAVVEERRGLIRLVRIDADTQIIRADQGRTIDLGSRHEDNRGFESLAYDPATRSLLTIRELPPYDLTRITLDGSGAPGPITCERLSLDVDDVSAMSLDHDGRLWILSEASSRLLRLGHGGREEFRSPVRAGGLPFQPEGLAFGVDGTIFIVGEPDVLVVANLNKR